MTFKLSFEANPNPEDTQTLIRGITDYAKQQRGFDALDFFAFFIRDENNSGVPEDTTIEPYQIYIYLVNGHPEYAARDRNGVIERVDLSQYIRDVSDIVDILNSPPALLRPSVYVDRIFGQHLC